MRYQLFLFDLDDTLLDFKASEQLSFFRALDSLGVREHQQELFTAYQPINKELWRQFEVGAVSKEFLKIERFRATFATRGIDVDPELASTRYLDTLPETVVLLEHAEELCRQVSAAGELGIITNGIQYVQLKRIQNSPLAPYIHFISVSEECGFAKPDVRFFEYTVSKARQFSRQHTVIVGDRYDADIVGGHRFGIDSIWLNPEGKRPEGELRATHEVKHLRDVAKILLADT